MIPTHSWPCASVSYKAVARVCARVLMHPRGLGRGRSCPARLAVVAPAWEDGAFMRKGVPTFWGPLVPTLLAAGRAAALLLVLERVRGTFVRHAQPLAD
jgi:hypothetical protein